MSTFSVFAHLSDQKKKIFALGEKGQKNTDGLYCTQEALIENRGG